MSGFPEHYCKLPTEEVTDKPDCDCDESILKMRGVIEPWLSAIFQSEHLALLTGNGLTTAIANLAQISPPNMERMIFSIFTGNITHNADMTAKEIGRGAANFEDDLRTALELLKGLSILNNEKTPSEDYTTLKDEIESSLANLIKSIYSVESFFSSSEKMNNALKYLKSFLISFASRTATRDRLQIFTTNYDRFIEYACDMAGILLLDRFIGKIQPIFRTTKLELDYHYNPPGIRGEPRYVEGVARLTKLHGSIDWRFVDGKITKVALPFGAKPDELKIDDIASQFVIFPNSSKDIETTYFPYAELFRDFSSAISRPNSVLVTYGYGFGDSHVNRIIGDMLTIPSTHLVIISYDGASGRIESFYNNNNPAQFTLLLGNHFGDLKTLVDHYLPKAAIDRLSIKMQQLKSNRGDLSDSDDPTQQNPPAQDEYEQA